MCLILASLKCCPYRCDRFVHYPSHHRIGTRSNPQYSFQRRENSSTYRPPITPSLIIDLIPLLKDDPNGVTLLNEVVKPSLFRLKDDSDGDVRYYATQAIQCF
jgi:hypothetical protein